MSLVRLHLQSYNFEVLFAAKQKYKPIKDIVLMGLLILLNLILQSTKSSMGPLIARNLTKQDKSFWIYTSGLASMMVKEEAL